MSIFAILTGSQTFDIASAKALAFVMEPCRRLDQHNSPRLLPNKVLGVEGKPAFQPADRQGNPLHGYWVQSRLQGSEGVILQLHLSMSYRAAIIRQGALLIRLRAAGPLLTIKGQIPAQAQSIYANGVLPLFEGRGDLLTWQAAEPLGIRFAPGIRRAAFDPEQIAECFTVQTLAPGLAPEPKVERAVVAGQEQTVVIHQPPARRLRLRPKPK